MDLSFNHYTVMIDAKGGNSNTQIKLNHFNLISESLHTKCIYSYSVYIAI